MKPTPCDERDSPHDHANGVTAQRAQHTYRKHYLRPAAEPFGDGPTLSAEPPPVAFAD